MNIQKKHSCVNVGFENALAKVYHILGLEVLDEYFLKVYKNVLMFSKVFKISKE